MSRAALGPTELAPPAIEATVTGAVHTRALVVTHGVTLSPTVARLTYALKCGNVLNTMKASATQ